MANAISPERRFRPTSSLRRAAQTAMEQRYASSDACDEAARQLHAAEARQWLTERGQALQRHFNTVEAERVQHVAATDATLRELDAVDAQLLLERREAQWHRDHAADVVAVDRLRRRALRRVANVAQGGATKFVQQARSATTEALTVDAIERGEIPDVTRPATADADKRWGGRQCAAGPRLDPWHAVLIADVQTSRLQFDAKRPSTAGAAAPGANAALVHATSTFKLRRKASAHVAADAAAAAGARGASSRPPTAPTAFGAASQAAAPTTALCESAYSAESAAASSRPATAAAKPPRPGSSVASSSYRAHEGVDRAYWGVMYSAHRATSATRQRRDARVARKRLEATQAMQAVMDASSPCSSPGLLGSMTPGSDELPKSGDALLTITIPDAAAGDVPTGDALFLLGDTSSDSNDTDESSEPGSGEDVAYAVAIEKPQRKQDSGDTHPVNGGSATPTPSAAYAASVLGYSMAGLANASIVDASMLSGTGTFSPVGARSVLSPSNRILSPSNRRVRLTRGQRKARIAAHKAHKLLDRLEAEDRIAEQYAEHERAAAALRAQRDGEGGRSPLSVGSDSDDDGFGSGSALLPGAFDHLDPKHRQHTAPAGRDDSTSTNGVDQSAASATGDTPPFQDSGCSQHGDAVQPARMSSATLRARLVQLEEESAASAGASPEAARPPSVHSPPKPSPARRSASVPHDDEPADGDAAAAERALLDMLTLGDDDAAGAAVSGSNMMMLADPDAILRMFDDGDEVDGELTALQRSRAQQLSAQRITYHDFYDDAPLTMAGEQDADAALEVDEVVTQDSRAVDSLAGTAVRDGHNEPLSDMDLDLVDSDAEGATTRSSAVYAPPAHLAAIRLQAALRWRVLRPRRAAALRRDRLGREAATVRAEAAVVIQRAARTAPRSPLRRLQSTDRQTAACVLQRTVRLHVLLPARLRAMAARRLWRESSLVRAEAARSIQRAARSRSSPRSNHGTATE